MSAKDEEGILVPSGCHVAKAGRWADSSEAHGWMGRGFVKSTDGK